MKFLACAVLLLPAYSFAAEWVTLTGAMGVSNSVDVKSVSSAQNGDRRAWFQYVYDNPQVNDEGKTYTRVVELSVFKCAEHKAAVVRQIRYSPPEQGTLVSDVALSESQQAFVDVIPDSLGEDQFDFVCKGKPKKGKST